MMGAVSKRGRLSYEDFQCMWDAAFEISQPAQVLNGPETLVGVCLGFAIV